MGLKQAATPTPHPITFTLTPLPNKPITLTPALALALTLTLTLTLALALALTLTLNQDFLQLPRAIPSSRVLRVANRNSHAVKAKPSRKVNETLDSFFAPYNAQLYAWMEMQGRQFKPWD